MTIRLSNAMPQLRRPGRARRRLPWLRRCWTIAVAGAALALPASSESYTVTTQEWFLNTETPNWTCGPKVVGPCTVPRHHGYKFFGVWPVRPPNVGWGGTMAWAVAGGGEVCAGVDVVDGFCIFHGPNNTAGWLRGVGLQMVNDRPYQPESDWIWNLNSAFYDDHLGRMFLIANRSSIAGVGGIPNESEFWIGESSDLGMNISWTRLLIDGLDSSAAAPAECRTAPTQRCWIHRLSVVPNPLKPGVWSGVLTYGHRTSPIEVDYGANPRTLRLLDAAGNWVQNQPFGIRVSWFPFSYTSHTGAFGTATFTHHGSGWRLEIWANGNAGAMDNDPSDGPCRLAANACPDPPTASDPRYCANRRDAGQAGKTRPRYYRLDPTTLAKIGDWILPTETVPGPDLTQAGLAYPTDYKAYNWNVFAWDRGSGMVMYQGNEDLFICDHRVDWHPQSGAGVSSHVLQFQP